MTTASVSQLKAKLSAYLDKVKAGEEVIVTDRGRVVARVVPAVGPAGPSATDWDELVRGGLVTAPASSLHGWWDREHVEDPDGKVLDALLADRSDAR